MRHWRAFTVFFGLLSGLPLFLQEAVANVVGYQNESSTAVHVLHLREVIHRWTPPAEHEPGPQPHAVRDYTELVYPGQSYSNLVRLEYQDDKPPFWERREVFLQSVEVVEAPKIKELVLVSIKGDPQALLSAPREELLLGESVALRLEQSNGAGGRLLEGPGLGAGLAEPAESVTVQPVEAGLATYRYTVATDGLTLRWSSNSPVGDFHMNLPDGRRVNLKGHVYYRATQTGLYSITQSNVAGTASSAPVRIEVPGPAVAELSIRVLDARVPQLVLQPNAVRISAPGRSWDGREVVRSWLEGERACAWLGREGVCFAAKLLAGGASGDKVELQALSPGAEGWETLAETELLGNAGAWGAHFSLRLGEVEALEPLVPSSWKAGHALVGAWRFRCRVLSQIEGPGDWGPDLVVDVRLPLRQHEETLQSLPPAGALAGWFVASEPKTFRFQVWIP